MTDSSPLLVPHDRLTKLRIRGFRSIEDITLDLDGLTVLIGDNGAGKSTIIEAIELLRKAARPGDFQSDVSVHGGLSTMLRSGANKLAIDVWLEGAGGPPVGYGFELSFEGLAPRVVGEHLDLLGADGPPRSFARRDATGARVHNEERGELESIGAYNGLLLHAFGPRDATLAARTARRVIEALDDRALVYASFDVSPPWLTSERGERRVPMRDRARANAAAHLERSGGNLTNCLHTLKERPSDVRWRWALDMIRLGLGLDVTEIKFPPVARGDIEMQLRLTNNRTFTTASLSDGQLCYLAFVAVFALDDEHAILAFDEPEIHLHPALLARVVWMMEDAATRGPIIVSTHSDRFLDALHDPAKTVVLCDLDEQRRTRLRRPDAAELADWLKQYAGLGALRADGMTREVFVTPEEP